MRRLRSGRSGRALLLVALVAVPVATYIALAASTTVPASRAGDGSRAITGYAVSGVQYTLRAADPSRFQRVRFRLDSRAARVRISFGPSGTWRACTLSANGRTATCRLGTGVPVAAAASLRVVATG